VKVPLFIAALAAAVPSAHADSALRPERVPVKARELASRGRVLHEGGDYHAAIAAFQEAYVLAPSPGLLFNLAQSYRLAGNCDDAAWMYRRFLDTNPLGDHRTLAEQHLAFVRTCGNGGLRLGLPAQRPSDVPAPPEPARLTAERHAAPSPAPPYKRVGAYTALGGGLALAGAAVFALDARDAARVVEDRYQRGGRWSDVSELNARGERSATIARVLGAGGGLALVSAAVLYGAGIHKARTRQIAITPTDGGAEVSLSWGF
jgi:tetratricopeptide (TPR) repeat protein